MRTGRNPVLIASFFAPRHDQWGADYLALLRLLDKSCQRFGLDHLCISDRDLKVVDTLVCKLPDNLMIAIIDGQKQCLEWTQEPVLFVGADCLIAKDPRAINGGDLTITTSDTFGDCRMNTGAIWCHNPARCVPIWRAAVDAQPEQWGDDQIALYEAVKASGASFQEVPAETENWAPDDVSDNAGMPTVVHFRGTRKAWMAEWARRWMQLT